MKLKNERERAACTATFEISKTSSSRGKLLRGAVTFYRSVEFHYRKEILRCKGAFESAIKSRQIKRDIALSRWLIAECYFNFNSFIRICWGAYPGLKSLLFEYYCDSPRESLFIRRKLDRKMNSRLRSRLNAWLKGGSLVIPSVISRRRVREFNASCQLSYAKCCKTRLKQHGIPAETSDKVRSSLDAL